ncbi:uncharacterized protein [Dermacentor andersoni]|uniref:uncharacterized protein n=1 Tax=Dermacentor andersoni TaxID=34620 RepID=UPI002416E953|nr:heat shock protein DDB_G0288861-like [Dermacentor andersoni]
MARDGEHRCVTAALGAFLWLTLLSGVCSGYRDSSSWQALAPGAAPAEHKLARAFVVHLPIHTTQLEPVEDQRQPASVAAPPGGQAGFETHGQNQVGREQFHMSEAEELKKLVILLRIPQEQPAAFPQHSPPPPEVKRQPESDKADYDVQVDNKLPIILIALDKPLASHAKVQSVSAWKEQLPRPASSKEDRSSGNSKEWKPIIYPRKQRQYSTPAPQRQWSHWNKNLDRRTLWTKEQRQSSWKPAAPSSDNVQTTAPAKEQHNDGGSNEAKLLLLLVHENSAASGDRGKTWEPATAQQNLNEPTASPWRPSNKLSQPRQPQIMIDVMQKSWRSAGPSRGWAQTQQRSWQQQQHQQQPENQQQQQQQQSFRPRPVVWHSGVPNSSTRGSHYNSYVQKRNYDHYGPVHRY